LVDNRRRISLFAIRTAVISSGELGMSNGIVSSGVDALGGGGDGCGMRLRTLSGSRGTNPAPHHADSILVGEKSFALAAAYAESHSAF
jgi:hypothetical protein